MCCFYGSLFLTLNLKKERKERWLRLLKIGSFFLNYKFTYCKKGGKIILWRKQASICFSSVKLFVCFLHWYVQVTMFLWLHNYAWLQISYFFFFFKLGKWVLCAVLYVRESVNSSSLWTDADIYGLKLIG